MVTLCLVVCVCVCVYAGMRRVVVRRSVNNSGRLVYGGICLRLVCVCVCFEDICVGFVMGSCYNELRLRVWCVVLHSLRACDR